MRKSKWSIDLILEVAKEYTRISDFKLNNTGAYSYLVKNKMVNILRTFYGRKSVNKWNELTIIDEISKYVTLKEFYQNSKAAYNAAYRLGILKEVTKNLIRNVGEEDRCIYSYEFSDNHVYVGLSGDLIKRNKTRGKNENDGVIKHSKETTLIPKLIQLTEYVNCIEASKLEGIYLNKYISEGWIPLNKIKTGGLGGNIKKWNYDTCKNEALKYQNRTDFNNGATSAVKYAIKNGFYDEICSHMIRKSKQFGYWSEEKCFETSKLYNNIDDLYKNYPQAYNKICENKWNNEMLSNYNYKTKPKGYWKIKINCVIEINKYNTLKEFRTKSRGAYSSCLENKWDTELFEKFNLLVKRKNYWTEEILLKLIETSDAKNISEFKNNNGGAFWKINKIGLINILREKYNMKLK